MITADVIQGFSSSLLQKNFDQATASPDCHREWWELMCSKHSQVAISAPRGHAKSTACTLTYLLACLVFRESSYALLISDTVSQAGQFLADIKRELSENENIVNLFSITGFSKDTEDDVIVDCEDGHQFRITARGSEQKLRGLKWNNKRPDLIICDDLENDEIVMNPERRSKFKRWFYGALIPCKSRNGKIRIVGTILHEDSLLNNIMPKVWEKSTKFNALKTWSTKNTSWLSVKYRAHNEDFSHILWESRYDREWFEEKRADFIDQGLADVYSQEYLNEPIDDSVAYFKRADFDGMSEEDKGRNLHYYLTADLAISESETADYSVFLLAGIDENRMIHVKEVIRDRLDGREIVDLLLALQNTYQPELVGIEEMQVSKAIGPFLREEMVKTGIYLNLRPMKHGGKDKIQRARSIQARMRAGGVRFDKSADWYPQFEEELCKFPRGRKDDQVDAFAYLGLMLDSLIEAPTAQEQEEEDYINELQSSGFNNDGRSQWTGY
jgi:predicted phage terminase large subunit-like protein